MITFKQFLQEKAMNRTAYVAVMKRFADKARIGFEIELFCPKDSNFWLEASSTTAKNVMYVPKFDSIDEYREVFNVPYGAATEIQNDYGSWLAHKQDEYADEHWEEFDQDDEKAGRKSAMRAFDNPSWTEWHNEEFTDGIAFVKQYALQPKYGWHDSKRVYSSPPEEQNYMAGWRQTALAVAKDLQHVVDDVVQVNATGYTHWNITHDSSIKDNENVDYESGMNGYGLEIVSPPLPPADAMVALERVLHWANKYGFETNESTGIHVNLSLDDMSKFDSVKLVLFMGDKHILSKFNRTTNTFTKSQLQTIIDGISYNGTLPKSAEEIIEYGKRALKITAKYYSVNLQHMPKYLEFRAAGGAGYHHRIKDIEEVVGRWLTALEIACDPNLEKREYLKKVMGLLGKTPQETSKQESGTGSFNEWVLKKEPHLADMISTAHNLQDNELRKKVMRTLMVELGKRLKNETILPTFAWRKELRTLFSQWKINGENVLENAKGETAKLAAIALKAFKLI